MRLGELRATMMTASARPRHPRRRGLYRMFTAAAAALAFGNGAAIAQTAFIPNYIVTSTVPANGDVNPYGVALVPPGFPAGGKIAPFDILVSNFNNKKNMQGTGTTIVTVTPNGVITPPGQATVFFQSGKNAGLDTALGTLQAGFVVVGSLPAPTGLYASRKPGALLFINKNGILRFTLAASATSKINGPWDMTIFDQGTTAKVFVSNVGTHIGSVTRLDLAVTPTTITLVKATVISRGYTVRPNAGAFVFGPTGLVYDPNTDILYVASTADNAIFAVKNAGARVSSVGQGIMIFDDAKVLRGPLGMAQAPNGNLVVANGDGVNGNVTHPSEYVEFTKGGTFVGQFNIDVNQGGAFGIGTGVGPSNAPRLAVVNDNLPGLDIFTGAPPAITARPR